MAVLAVAACATAASGNLEQGVETSVESAGADPSHSALLIVRLEDGMTWSSGGGRVDERFVAASTSKIPHTLIAIETGAVSGPDEWFEWDGQTRFLPAWNKSQTLADAFRHSTVWIYQTITPRIGSEALRGWLAAFGYGNADTGAPEDITSYWLRGPLRISVREQVAFLTRLVRHELPLSDRTYELALPVMLAEEGENWRLHAKTGWYSSEDEQDIGWYVGWLEQLGGQAPGTYVFAFNLDVVTPETDIPKRPAAVRQALEDIGALPVP
ncbi:OXA-1090 family carbapenem-hydrolyzing class D beta-lactamase [Hyphomonas sp.]|uniref:OXA-1090 family carbapenem-hydrolyzing class D beta-lactamase n=1 Tax=Hyphomonas sp. TaxID=87 RepID=UPI003526FA2A